MNGILVAKVEDMMYSYDIKQDLSDRSLKLSCANHLLLDNINEYYDEMMNIFVFGLEPVRSDLAAHFISHKCCRFSLVLKV